MIYPAILAISICILVLGLYIASRYFDYKQNALELSKDVSDDLLCKLELLTAELSEMKTRNDAYEKRFDAIVKTLIIEIKEIVKFEEDKVRTTQAAAYKVSSQRR